MSINDDIDMDTPAIAVRPYTYMMLNDDMTPAKLTGQDGVPRTVGILGIEHMSANPDDPNISIDRYIVGSADEVQKLINTLGGLLTHMRQADLTA